MNVYVNDKLVIKMNKRLYLLLKIWYNKLCDYMKKMYIFIGIFIIFILSITVIGSFVVMGGNSIKMEKDILEVQSNKEVYFNVYGYDIDNPSIIVNPYGNSPLTALVMFTSNDYSETSVTIKGKYDNDINYSFNKDKYHLIPIYGLYPDYDNTIVVRCEGRENIINIKTEGLPEDFTYSDDMNYDNYSFYNVNYPYAIDSYGDVRWYLNEHYFGNITMLDNSNIIIGSNSYNEEENSTISFYRMNLIGKIYGEYLLKDNYYGLNSVYEDNIVIKSDKYLVIDLQTGNVTNELEEIDASIFNNNIFNLYNNTVNYNISKSVRFGKLSETKADKKSIHLLKYSKFKDDDISLSMDSNRIKVTNNSDNDIYIIFDKFLNKKIYKVEKLKYINLEGLSGKYNIYYKIKNKVYKTDYYVEV